MKNKKIWLSVGLILLVAGGAIAGTTAYFTAQRTASTNRFVAGTLDMSVLSDNAVLNEPFVIENMGANANLSGTKTWTIKNTGTLPGRLLVRLQNVVNKENGCANDQEKAADPTCDTSGKEGDLGKVVNLNVSLDGVDKVSSDLQTVNQSKIGDDWNAIAPIIVVQPGESTTVTAHWATPETGYGNEIQGDSTEFDINFRLIQLINGPTPANH